MAESGEKWRESDSRVCFRVWGIQHHPSLSSLWSCATENVLFYKVSSEYKQGFLGIVRSRGRVPASVLYLLALIPEAVERENKKTVKVSAFMKYLSKTFLFPIYKPLVIFMVLLFPSSEYFYLDLARKLYWTLIWIPKEIYTSCLMLWNVRKSVKGECLWRLIIIWAAVG